ncbi:MAG: aryl-sulfate sulfohydrolase [Gemmatales bacterium]|nr:MAG: aryl-sulfate sulfohydrolase [Gemmatales bacterium]
MRHLLISLFCCSVFLADVHAVDKGKPNIVLIVADDLGWTDVGCFGSRYYETPHIDRLRKEGMQFSAAYTCGPNCAPTRACLMTGRYTPRHGIYTVSTGARGLEKFRKLVPVPNRTSLPLSEVTIANVLKEAGYKTGMFGKWHLGNADEYHPSRRGFDEAIVSAGRHFNFVTDPRMKIAPGTYLADFLTDQAVRFIEKNKNETFFLYLPHFSVHSPFQAKKDRITKYEKKKPIGGHNNPVYAGMIDSLDESVGRILNKLDELNLAKNTIVLFYSDNGGLGGYDGLQIRNITSNAPLRGGKGMLYEGGIRVPMILRWPGVVGAGTTCDEPIISVDFLPTLAELAGVSAEPKNPIDGVSFVPLLKNSRSRIRRDAIYWHFPGYLQANVRLGTWRTTPAGAIRAGNLKLIEFFEDGRRELYDLNADIGEKNNLVDKRPEDAERLYKMLTAWRKSVNAPMPTKKER